MPEWLCGRGRGTVFGPSTTLHSHREAPDATQAAMPDGDPPAPDGPFGHKIDGVPFKL
jgi:hypothetical protein